MSEERRQLKHEVYMRMAQQLARLSTCRRLSVGTVLLRRDGSVAGVGYNGALPGQPHCAPETCNPPARSPRPTSRTSPACAALRTLIARGCRAVKKGTWHPANPQRRVFDAAVDEYARRERLLLMPPKQIPSSVRRSARRPGGACQMRRKPRWADAEACRAAHMVRQEKLLGSRRRLPQLDSINYSCSNVYPSTLGATCETRQPLTMRRAIFRRLRSSFSFSTSIAVLTGYAGGARRG